MTERERLMRDAFEALFQADSHDPAMADELQHFQLGWNAAWQAARAEQPEG